MKKNIKRALSLLTASILTLGVFAPINVLAEETISLSTVTDFKDFTEKCVYDEY